MNTAPLTNYLVALTYRAHLARRQSNRFLRFAAKCSEGLLAGIQLGLYRAQTLQDLTNSYYHSNPLYKDSTYNSQGLHLPEQELVDQLEIVPEKVLVSSCGAGREVLYWVARGATVTAFEGNEDLFHAAKRNFANLESKVKLLFLPFDRPFECSDSYDLIVVGWNAFGHITTRSERVHYLRMLAARINSGGRMLISYYPNTRQARTVRKLSKWVSKVLLAIRRRSFNSRLLFFYGGSPFPFCSTYYDDEGDFETEVLEAGFRIESRSGTYPAYLLSPA